MKHKYLIVVDSLPVMYANKDVKNVHVLFPWHDVH